MLTVVIFFAAFIPSTILSSRVMKLPFYEELPMHFIDSNRTRSGIQLTTYFVPPTLTINSAANCLSSDALMIIVGKMRHIGFLRIMKSTRRAKESQSQMQLALEDSRSIRSEYLTALIHLAGLTRSQNSNKPSDNNVFVLDSIFSRKVRYDVGRATEYQPYEIMHSIFTILLTSITNSTSIRYMILLMTILTRKWNLF